MEIRIFKSFDLCIANKPLFCAIISVPDLFSFEKFIDVFRSIYGSGIIIEFRCMTVFMQNCFRYGVSFPLDFRYTWFYLWYWSHGYNYTEFWFHL